MGDTKLLHHNHPINWLAISEAVDHYCNYGFRYVELPWIVHQEAVYATLPANKTFHKIEPPNPDNDVMPRRALVGSAEQGFVQAMIEGRMPHGTFVAAGPCFRDDPIDKLHQKTFFKVELIEVLANPLDADGQLRKAFHMAEFARGFMSHLLTTGMELDLVRTADGYDLELDGIEVGSYGYRVYNDNQWVYGTGLAEPRWTQAIEASWRKGNR
jgi:hypothetical protein